MRVTNTKCALGTYVMFTELFTVKLDHLKNSLAAIRHARWFEESAFQSSIRVIVRIYKDFKRRIPFFANVNPWTIDLLAHHAAVANTGGQQLTVPQVFR